MRIRGINRSLERATAKTPRPAAAAGRQRSEWGAELVEFAILVPLLALFLFGIIDFGWAYTQNLDVKHGAREGARLAVVNGGTTSCASATCTPTELQNNCNAIVNQIKTDMGDSPDKANVHVALSYSGAAIGQTATVKVSYPLKSLSGFTRQFLSGTMQSTVTMRLEQVPNWGATTPTPAAWDPNSATVPSC